MSSINMKSTWVVATFKKLSTSSVLIILLFQLLWDLPSQKCESSLFFFAASKISEPSIDRQKKKLATHSIKSEISKTDVLERRGRTRMKG